MFNEARLLDIVDYGTSFEQAFNTRVVTLKSGHERRNAEWSTPLGAFSVLYSVLRDEHHRAVYDAHMACMGRLIGFRFKDWSDYQAEDEFLTVGTGEPQEVRLHKTHNFGTVSFVRDIFKPVAGSVTIKANGVPIAGQIDYTTGIVKFVAPAGSEVTWTGEYDKPVRFESDKLALESKSWSDRGLILSANVDLVEVRL